MPHSFMSKSILHLLLAVAIGIGLGYLLPENGIAFLLAIKQVTGQIIFFLIPLIIIAFVATSIAQQQGNVSRTLVFAFAIAYLSSIGAAFFSAGAAEVIIPWLHVPHNTEAERALPQLLFQLDIPPVMPVMTALLLSILSGLGAIWTKSDRIVLLLHDFQRIVLQLVERVLLPILPFYIAANFAALAFEGTLGKLTIFLPVILIVIVLHYVWLTLLFIIASLYSGKNGWQVLRHYLPAYLTALGTMSSAATLGIALKCAHRSTILQKDSIDFGIPLFANIHLCGSVLTEVFFIGVVSVILYGQLPDFGTMAFFILLFGVFAVGAPGVPGGTVLASLGLVVSVFHFDDSATALLIAIFALQDSFGTACNVTGDGALTLMLDKFKQSRAATE